MILYYLYIGLYDYANSATIYSISLPMSTQANGLCDPQLPIIYSLAIGNTAAIMQEIMQTQATAQMGLFFPKKLSHIVPL